MKLVLCEDACKDKDLPRLAQVEIFFVCLCIHMFITYPLLLCLLNGCDLLGHHRQHLDINAVELIKASPCTRAGQGRKNEGSQEHHTGANLQSKVQLDLEIIIPHTGEAAQRQKMNLKGP